MISLVSKIADRLFAKRVVVNCDRNPYLTRWYLFRSEPLGVFLHRFHRSDEDRALHDHPWSFLTIILWRGYVEHFERSQRLFNGEFHRRRCVARRWPLMICWRPAEWRHRVELIDGKEALTLVFRFRERRVWGFWEPKGFVKWNHWWQQNCE